MFPSAANLKMESGWELLTVVASSGDDLPHGIRVDSPPGFTFEDLQANEPVICRDGFLRFGQSPTIIDLRNAVRWKCDLLGCRFDMTSPLVRSVWRFVWRALNCRQGISGSEIVAANLIQVPPGGGSALFSRFANGTAGLLRAAARCDLVLRSVVSSLIGLGPGLTPAGDDLLVGYIVGLLCRTGQELCGARTMSEISERS